MSHLAIELVLKFWITDLFLYHNILHCLAEMHYITPTKPGNYLVI